MKSYIHVGLYQQKHVLTMAIASSVVLPMESPTMCGLCLPMYRCSMNMQLLIDIHSNESTNLISQDQSMNQLNPSVYLFLLVTCL